MKLTKAQLKQLIKEELSEINLEDLGQDPRSQHTARRGVKKRTPAIEAIADHIRNLPAWKQYTHPEYEETDYWKLAVTPEDEEQATKHEERLMKLAGGLYGEYGHKWEEHLPNIKNYIEDVTSPTYLSHVARTN